MVESVERNFDWNELMKIAERQTELERKWDVEVFGVSVAEAIRKGKGDSIYSSSHEDDNGFLVVTKLSIRQDVLEHATSEEIKNMVLHEFREVLYLQRFPTKLRGIRKAHMFSLKWDTEVDEHLRSKFPVFCRQKISKSTRYV